MNNICKRVKGRVHIFDYSWAELWNSPYDIGYLGAPTSGCAKGPPRAKSGPVYEETPKSDLDLYLGFFNISIRVFMLMEAF